MSGLPSVSELQQVFERKAELSKSPSTESFRKLPDTFKHVIDPDSPRPNPAPRPVADETLQVSDISKAPPSVQQALGASASGTSKQASDPQQSPEPPKQPAEPPKQPAPPPNQHLETKRAADPPTPVASSSTSSKRPALDAQFVPLRHVLDRWLVSADYIARDEGSDLYHANLAALAALKDLYLLKEPKWEPFRDQVYVGIIKDEKGCGTSSVSMGVAVEYFQAFPARKSVMILNCGTGGTKYGLYTCQPCINEVYKGGSEDKDGQIACIQLKGCSYDPRTKGLIYSCSVDTVEEALGKQLKKSIQECVEKKLCDEHVEAIAFITGSIRGFYTDTVDERPILDKALNNLFANIGVNKLYEQKGNNPPTFFLDQVREGELELLAVQEMHKNCGIVGKLSPKYVPVVSFGIGRGTAQWAMPTLIISHAHGMNNIPGLSKLGEQICKELHGPGLKVFLDSIQKQLTAGNCPVIAMKSGCTLAFTNQVSNFHELKTKFLALEPKIIPLPDKVKLRLFLAQNGNPNVPRVAWRKPHDVTTIDALCALAPSVLGVKANFIVVYHANGSRIRYLEDIASEDLLLFSQGEAFGAPPGLPNVTAKKKSIKLMPLSWIPDRWLLGHKVDIDEEDRIDEKYTHATLSTLKELWFFGTPEWNEVRDKVHICFEEDFERFTDEQCIITELKNEISDEINQAAFDVKVTKERKDRIKFVKENKIQTINVDLTGHINFCSVTRPYADFAKDFVQKVRLDHSTEFEQLRLGIAGAKFPFVVLTRRALPLLEPITKDAHTPGVRKRNEYRAQLRAEFNCPLDEPPVAPPDIRVYFGLNTEDDGNAFRVSPKWSLSRVCAEAVQVLCPGMTGMLFTRVFNRVGFEIQPVKVLSPIGMKDEDTLFFSFGEDFGEEVSGTPSKCTIPAIPLFSVRKLADIDIATGRIKVVFDFALLVPRDGVPKEVRRDGFLVKPLRVTLNSEEFTLDNPTSLILLPSPETTFSHVIPPGQDRDRQFYKWKARPTIEMCLNSCDDDLHDAIRACPFDVHTLHFVIELKTVRTRAFKVRFDMHLMKRSCFVRDKEKVDYLPEFDVDWETARVELATRVPIGIEAEKWTDSLEKQDLLCVGQEEFMLGVDKSRGGQEKDPKWLDAIDSSNAETYFPNGGCNCVFRDFTAELKAAQRLKRKPELKFDEDVKTEVLPSFSRFVVCPKHLIRTLDDSKWCKLQQNRQKLLDSADGAFSVLHYSVLIRRDPTLLTLLAVVPVFLLCLLALAIVWQATAFSESIANIAAVLLALFAYSPVVRDRLPPSPSITVIDKLLNYAILVCFIVLITAVIQEGFRQKYAINDQNMEEVVVDSEVAKLYLARISLVSTLIITTGHVIVFCYFIYHVLLFKYAERRQSMYVKGLDREAVTEQLRDTDEPDDDDLPMRPGVVTMQSGLGSSKFNLELGTLGPQASIPL